MVSWLNLQTFHCANTNVCRTFIELWEQLHHFCHSPTSIAVPLIFWCASCLSQQSLLLQ